MCLDLGTNKVHAAEVIAPGETSERAAEVLARAMGKALARGAPPRIRTDAEDLAGALRTLLPATVTIDVGPTAELDAVAETVRRFFESASRLYRAAPWTRIHSDSQRSRYKKCCMRR